MKGFDDVYNPEHTATYDFFMRPLSEAQPTAPLRASPIGQFFSDIKNLCTRFKLVATVLALLHTDREIDELYRWPPTVYSLIGFALLSIGQVFILFPLLMIFAILAAAVTCFTTIRPYIWSMIQGPQIQVYPPSPPSGYNPRQRWIYINGIATGKTITRQNLQCLSDTFHNPVLAVNNRTYGFLGDILECITQRSFGFRTTEEGIAFHLIKEYLQSDEIESVVFVAHSQGGIIASQVLDDLYCSVSQADLGKMEVYTFGSAALTFNNPVKDKRTKERVIPIMEHYCNEQDMVTSWGALSSSRHDEVSFEGKIFLFHGQTGHMLNQHYLRHMFPGPEYEWPQDCFLRRSITLDAIVRNKYHVWGQVANDEDGEISVKSQSRLWKYLEDKSRVNGG